MSPRKNPESFEKAIERHESIVVKRPIGRAALLKSIDLLVAAGTEARRNGAITVNELAETMRDTLSPITAPEYTKPPLTTEHLANIAGKLNAYETIIDVHTPEAEAPIEPTDTKKLDTSKRKA